MTVLESIRDRRSVRSFTKQEIPAKLIDRLLELGTRAATGSGQQPWGFVIITDQAELKQLSDDTKKYLREHLDQYPYFRQYLDWLKDEHYHIFYEAPCLLMIYGNSASHWYVYDCTLAAGNIMLAAGEYGLGTCWIGFAEQVCDTPAWKEKYHVPANYNLVCPMVIGYPKERLTPSNRKPAQIFFRG